MGYTLTKTFRFEAAHHLPGHDGKCARVHGHSWVGHVIVTGDSLIEEGPKEGMLVDYGDLSRAVQPIVEEFLDHWDLNESVARSGYDLVPTSENVAWWVFDLLKSNAQVAPLLQAVIIEETCTARCEYRP